ncbi:15972_t:CDS:2, partial [Racocetra fulgida]
MSINQLCNDTDDEVKEAAAVLENMKQGQMPTSPSGETDNTLMSRIGGEDVIIGGEKDDASAQNRKRGVHGELRSSSPSYRSPSRSHRSSQSNGSQNSSSLYSYPNNNNNNYTASNPTTTVLRNRLQQVLVGAGTAAGAAGAAVSEESMKSLKYCLQWLTYATQHIGNQIAALKSIIDSFTSPASSGALISQSSSKLAAIKKEVVDTLRKVIEVVSKYASICLPEHAKHNVRTNESLDMLRGVAGIFSETVGRAEAWVERLSSFGVTGGGANAMGHIHFDSIPQPNGNGYTYSQATSSPPSHSPVTPRSRRTSTNSAHDEDDDFSDSSSESDAESMRMEMDGRRVKTTSHSNGSLNGAKKRKKAGKKSENDRMDLS